MSFSFLHQKLYASLSRPFRKCKGLLNACVFTEKLLVGVSATAYLFTVFYALSKFGATKERLLSLLLFPALCFLTVSLLQKLVKRKRPYENGVQPLVPKNAYGNSFPSRHSACAFVIATTALPYFPLLGGVLFAVGAWITFFRFLFGHHYFTDLLCGSALGVGFGLLGMVL